MACFHPLKAAFLPNGKITFDTAARGVKRFLSLPCGQCVGCRLERSRQWAMRCVHESRMHKQNCFITLTYSPENLPPFGSLRYSDFQLFMKRLRKRFSNVPIRFYMCGEYGENFNRPHYHACIFGLDFPDKRPFSRSKSSIIYTSEILQSLWPFGYSSIGDVNFESAAYVARYIMKKVTGSAADAHYSVVSRETGEIVKLVPEFTKMSLKPGIGSTWYDKYASDVFPHDRVIFRNKSVSPPRYYSRKYRKTNRDSYDVISEKRMLAFRRNIRDNNRRRLDTKEFVTSERLRLLSRDSF